ncbi:hypothetical protein PABG_07249 [Paracoccidioides brasiliensis Pb03]|uniref:Rhodopsin domain-containing protein n=2 Tax=Paracoccidioides brasiliensis TaxID=121759 RepID=C1GD77_PARBD|nr:uncharacterized protein PADG_05213 [Paracoccidioides brasiliensis Pb18]EEH17162.2 hypothetical protein PABG_07249 [Paracoccidioides brasiliensis Pb03]EEH49134.2 hypothetical protein PADG_05213 [Paracoccidioides brasiliensis Pb18]ODH48188.1 hypothetical protein GX48_05679 [Paracoccidioides brasiliensis]
MAASRRHRRPCVFSHGNTRLELAMKYCSESMMGLLRNFELSTNAFISFFGFTSAYPISKMAVTPFKVEAWSECAVAVLIISVRIYYRCWRVRRNWDGDDYFAVLAIIFWAAQTSMLELIGRYGTTTGMNDEIALKLTEEEKRRIVIGTKCLLAGWCLYVTLIWCLKSCMLFLYKRLTLNLSQQRAVRITGLICTLAYIATLMVILTHCHPIQKVWQIYPYPGDSCALNIPNYLALVVTNVSTDVMIIYIPLPLLWKVKIPMRRKVLFGAWLCTGIFIIIAAIVRCILCLRDVRFINIATIWSVRETFVATIAVNIPVLKPLFSKSLRLATTGSSSKNTRSTSHDGSHQLTRIERKEKQNRIRIAMGLTTMDNSSEERMVQGFDPNSKNNEYVISTGSVETVNHELREPAEIHVTTTYNVS